jgi:hypothetical protein
VTSRHWILLALGLMLVIGLFLQPRIPQPGGYHHFADVRSIAGIPHALNVLSNLGFLAVGIMGMFYAASTPHLHARWSYFVLFAGVALTCFGSSYYHWDPGNERLVWDRLPMTIGFTGLFVAILAERVHSRAPLLLVPLITFGLFSVAYWHWTERQGAGDLRPYLLVQFLPLLLIPVMLLLFTPKFTRGADIFVAIALYGLAKIVELGDDQVFAGLGGTISGHSLKHLLAALAVYWLLRMLQKREAVEPKPAVAAAPAQA